MSEVKVDKISPKTGTSMTVGDSGDTFTVPSGATLTVAGALNVTGTTSLADGTVAVAELDIDGATDIGEAIVDADLFVVDNGAGGTNRKTAASRLKTYVTGANSVDSDQYVDGSIDLAHMSVNSIDSDQYVDGSIDTAHIGALQVTGAKLAADVISAQTALADIPATTDEFLVSDAGTLKRIDAGFVSNYPIFHLYKAGTTSFANDTTTQLVPTSVVRNDDSVYNTSNGRFTVQANQDFMYFFYGGFRIDNYDPNRCSAVFFVNGSELSHTMHEHSPQGDLTSRRPTIHATAFAQLSATDYVTFHGHQGSGSTDTVINAVFCGFKIGG